MKNIAEVLEGVKTVGIGGHIRPDGDCVGSCMALYLYIRTYFPDIDVTVYLDHPKPIFGHIECIDEIKTEADDSVFDLFITCDVSARDRLPLAGALFFFVLLFVCFVQLLIFSTLYFAANCFPFSKFLEYTAVNWISSNSKIPSISQSVIKLVPIVANLIISSPPSYILYFIVVTV